MNSYLKILKEQKNDHERSCSLPRKVREFLISHLPKKMFCSSTLKNQIGHVYPLPKHLALAHEHIQVNHDNLYNFIVIDDDGLDPSNFLELPVAPPNLIVINPITGHSQKWYFLEEGVTQTHLGSQKAKDYYAVTVFKLKAIYNGDPHYTGFLARNPFFEKHIVFSPRNEPYKLSEINNSIGVCIDDYNQENVYKSDAFLLIRDYCRRNKRLSDASSIGRNCTIFEILRHQAYKEWYEYSSEKLFAEYLFDQAISININRYSDNPLPVNELKHISNSIAKYCFSGKIYKKIKSDSSFSQRQSLRGHLGGKARSNKYESNRVKFLDLYKNRPHLKTKELAELCGLSERTIRNYKKELKCKSVSSLEKLDIFSYTNKELAEKLKVSIRTIQRRKAKARKISSNAINLALLTKINALGVKTASGHFSCIRPLSVPDVLFIPFTSYFCLKVLSNYFLFRPG